MIEPLELLQNDGDLLERDMFADAEFAKAFCIYPMVWSLYVRPHRKLECLTLVSPEWMRFAERHYSCIVRCWMAYTALREIADVCSNTVDRPTARDHLKLHRLLFEYFCSLGAAIDNLGIAFAEYPIESLNEFNVIYSRHNVEISLKDIFERRHQFIHKAVVPCFNGNGLLSLNASHFGDTEIRWDSPRPLKVQCVSQICDHYWHHFVKEMRAAWSSLLTQLRAAEPSTGAEIEVSPCKLGTIVWNAGSDVAASRWRYDPDPSG